MADTLAGTVIPAGEVAIPTGLPQGIEDAPLDGDTYLRGAAPQNVGQFSVQWTVNMPGGGIQPRSRATFTCEIIARSGSRTIIRGFVAAIDVNVEDPYHYPLEMSLPSGSWDLTVNGTMRFNAFSATGTFIGTVEIAGATPFSETAATFGWPMATALYPFAMTGQIDVTPEMNWFPLPQGLAHA